MRPHTAAVTASRLMALSATCGSAQSSRRWASETLSLRASSNTSTLSSLEARSVRVVLVNNGRSGRNAIDDDGDLVVSVLAAEVEVCRERVVDQLWFGLVGNVNNESVTIFAAGSAGDNDQHHRDAASQIHR